MKWRYYRDTKADIIWRFRKVTDRAYYYDVSLGHWHYGFIRVMGGKIKSSSNFVRIPKEDAMLEMI
jgi:hypothetical protein